jgi:hypothetical protein
MDSGRFDDTEYIAEMYGSRAVEWLRGEQVGGNEPDEPIQSVSLPYKSVIVSDLLPPGPILVGEFTHDSSPFGALPPTDEGKPVTDVCLPFGVPDRTHEVDRTFENETRLH